MNEVTWQQALVEANLKIFARSFRGVRFAPGLPLCSRGWQHIVTRLVDRVSEATNGYHVIFTQIAEEHGILRICWTTHSELPRRVEFAIEQAIALASARSACTCMECGEEGRLFCSGYRLVVACDVHQSGIPVPVVQSFRANYLVRAIVNGRSQLVCSRYDRSSDSFIDARKEAPNHELPDRIA